MIVRSAEARDSKEWERLRDALWPTSPGGHAGETARYFDGIRGNPAEVLLACSDTGVVIGFAELSIRSYAEECTSGRVAYLEGWYVVPEHRRRGAGAALVAAAEAWARSKGCTEMASDAELGNSLSASAHRALGFQETARIICFRKDLPS